MMNERIILRILLLFFAFIGAGSLTWVMSLSTLGFFITFVSLFAIMEFYAWLERKLF